MEVFKTSPSFRNKIFPSFLDSDEHQRIIKKVSSIDKSELSFCEWEDFGRYFSHNLNFFCDLQETYKSFVEEQVGEDLESSYNFLSLYQNGGKCEPHMDSPISKWTLDICLDQSHIWPIELSHYQHWPNSLDELKEEWLKILADRKEFREFHLRPKDALLFSGSSFWHKRSPIKRTMGVNSHCHLIFFHFIPKGTRELVNPANWPTLFDVPELRENLFLKNARIV